MLGESGSSRLSICSRWHQIIISHRHHHLLLVLRLFIMISLRHPLQGLLLQFLLRLMILITVDNHLWSKFDLWKVASNLLRLLRLFSNHIDELTPSFTATRLL